MSDRRRERPPDFPDVELATRSHPGSSFFIEATSSWSVFTSMLLLSCFLVLLIAASINSPPALGEKDEFYDFNCTLSNLSIDIDVSLSELRAAHRFVNLNASLVRTDPGFQRSVFLDMSLTETFYESTVVVKSDTLGPFESNLLFKPRDLLSSPFNVIHVEIEEVTSVQLRLTVSSDFTGIQGFLFRWNFFNPGCQSYTRSLRFFMSAFVGYALLAFALSLQMDGEEFTQIFLMVIGIAGVLFCNPFQYVIEDQEVIDVADHILAALFVGLCRLFIVSQLELIRSRSSIPRSSVAIFWTSFFVFYALVDATASYERSTQISEYPIPSESLRAVFAAVYLGVSALLLGMSVIRSDGMYNRRLEFFGASVVVTGAATMVSHIILFLLDIGLGTAANDLVFASIHTSFAATALFLMHSGYDQEYRAFDQAKNDGKGTVRDIYDLRDDEELHFAEEEEEEN
jgi:hypothetical protein